MSSEKKFYVYVHRRATDGTIFYVGKGHGCRATSKSGRNADWLSVTTSCEWNCEKVAENISEICAFSIEKAMIRYIGKDALCNIYDGGNGPSGTKHTEETKQKFRLAKLGRKQSPEHAAKSAKNKLGKKISNTSMFNIDKRRPVSNSLGDTFESAADAARQMSARLCVNASQGNISMVCSGIRKKAYGLGWSYAAE